MKNNIIHKYDSLVSIVMPNFNGEDFIDNAINSVLFQTHSNLELIIVDDCSVDGVILPKINTQ